MLKRNLIYSSINIVYIVLILVIFSCKTQKSNLKSVDNPKENLQYENTKVKEKPKALTIDSQNEQKAEEFAQKKAHLLCLQKQLNDRLKNTSDENQRNEILKELKQVEKSLTELGKDITTTFPKGDYKDMINKSVIHHMKDCQTY